MTFEREASDQKFTSCASGLLPHDEEVLSMARDPVCGMEVEESQARATTEYKGQKYYFCAVACKEKFEKEPEKYIQRSHE